MLKPFLTANWRYLAMLNFAVDSKILAPHVPAGTEVDFHNDKTYLSVVGFLFYHIKAQIYFFEAPLAWNGQAADNCVIEEEDGEAKVGFVVVVIDLSPGGELDCAVF